jgi:hypothetical protein
MTPEQTDAFVDAAAAAIGLDIPAECRPGVIENVMRMRQMAQRVMDFPLPPEAESAAVFTA